MREGEKSVNIVNDGPFLEVFIRFLLLRGWKSEATHEELGVAICHFGQILTEKSALRLMDLYSEMPSL